MYGQNCEGNKDVQSYEAVVMGIMESYFSKGKTLYTGNWNSSPVLLYYHFERDFNAIGTVKLSTSIPECMKIHSVNQGETMAP
jgi:hypothetical protein